MEATENKWVLVSEPGTDFQEVVAAFPTFGHAVQAMNRLTPSNISYDVMKLNADGTLTTEY
jgi:hypothetical protein